MAREKQKKPGDLQKRKLRHQTWQKLYDIKKALVDAPEVIEVINGVRYHFAAMGDYDFDDGGGHFLWKSKEYGPVVVDASIKDNALICFQAWLPMEKRWVGFYARPPRDERMLAFTLSIQIEGSSEEQIGR